MPDLNSPSWDAHVLHVPSSLEAHVAVRVGAAVAEGQRGREAASATGDGVEDAGFSRMERPKSGFQALWIHFEFTGFTVWTVSSSVCQDALQLFGYINDLFTQTDRQADTHTHTHTHMY